MAFDLSWLRACTYKGHTGRVFVLASPEWLVATDGHVVTMQHGDWPADVGDPALGIGSFPGENTADWSGETRAMAESFAGSAGGLLRDVLERTSWHVLDLRRMRTILRQNATLTWESGSSFEVSGIVQDGRFLIDIAVWLALLDQWGSHRHELVYAGLFTPTARTIVERAGRTVPPGADAFTAWKDGPGRYLLIPCARTAPKDNATAEKPATRPPVLPSDTGCHAAKDGECNWVNCPQKIPGNWKSHCPLDRGQSEDE